MEGYEFLPVTSRMKDLAGQVFGRLKVLGCIGKTSRMNPIWLCECTCGSIKPIEGNALTSGHTQSCGCLKKERTIECNTKHGMHNLRIHHIWAGMKNRCNNPNKDCYPLYGGRGISYDPKWESFEAFYEDMGDTYKEGLTLDRKDVNKGYYKDNCQWVTKGEQSYNRRNNTVVEYKGKRYKLIELYNELKPNLTYETIRHRMQRGWNIEKAFNEPALPNNK